MNNEEWGFVIQIAFLAGGAIGYAAGWGCLKAVRDARAESAKKERDHWKEEGMRLRAQVARLVGTTPLGVKSITQADCASSDAGILPRKAA